MHDLETIKEMNDQAAHKPPTIIEWDGMGFIYKREYEKLQANFQQLLQDYREAADRLNAYIEDHDNGVYVESKVYQVLARQYDDLLERHKDLWADNTRLAHDLTDANEMLEDEVHYGNELVKDYTTLCNEIFSVQEENTELKDVANKLLDTLATLCSTTEIK